MSEANSLSQETRTIQSVETTCEILDGMVELDGAGVTELADHLGTTKGTVYTHLATLQKSGLVTKEGDVYRPSFRFLEIGEQVRKSKRVAEIVKPEIDNLAETKDIRTHFVFEDHGQSVLAYVARGQNSLFSSQYIGRRWYLHCNAAGKAILANLSEARVAEIIDQHGLPRYTPDTITDPDELFDELEQIREEGVAYNDEEKITGMYAIGAPVSPSNESVLGAVSVAIPTNERSENSCAELADLVKKTASTIEVNYQIPS